jgi:hypothetical protein
MTKFTEAPLDLDKNDYATHIQVAVEYGEQEALVDAEMAPLIREIWRADINTIASCQDVGESLDDLPNRYPHMARTVKALQGTALIDFRPADAQRFFDAVADGKPPRAVYDRMTRWTAKGAWEVRMVLYDTCNTVDDRRFWVIGTQVRFPRNDIPAITKSLRRTNLRRPS